MFIEIKVELETSKSVQRILDKMDKKFEETNKKIDDSKKETNTRIDETTKETNSKIDLTNKRIESVVFDFQILKGIGAALGAIAAFVISSNLNTFIRIVFFGGK
jgi:hypothetical protein